MGWLDKLFGTEEPPKANALPPVASVTPFSGLEGIRFGRYTDNNKSYAKTQSWYAADDHFKAKEYTAAFAAFFDYISDDEEQNVVFRPDGKSFTFELIQGSKKVHGTCDGARISAHAAIAQMVQPSNAVMRRMLELNYSLFYSHCALDDNNILCMLFDSPIEMAAPAKLYYALREMAMCADRQDDLLVIDFTSLKPTDMDHIQAVPANEMEVKYTYFRKWIQETIDRAKDLNADSFSGAIAYLYLSLLYRIDFLIVPEAKLMADLEVINAMYWNRKDEIPIVERNSMMKEGIVKLLDITREQFADGLYRSKGTFAFASVPPMEKVRENVQSANKDAAWYVDNKYPELALIINEYGMVYNQFAYSLPKVITDLTKIYMAVVHAAYFQALGMNQLFYNPDSKEWDKPLITRAIDEAIARWPGKYVSLSWDHSKIDYKTLWDFARSFSEQVVSLNLEVKR